MSPPSPRAFTHAEIAKMAAGTRRTTHDSYFRLVRRFPLLAIKTQSDLAAAQRMIDDLLQRKLDAGGEQYLDALGDLVIAYEDKHVPIPDASAGDLLRLLIEANEMTQAELSRRAAIPRSVICEILAGHREISKRAMARLGALFRLPPAAFAPAAPAK